MRSLTTLSVLSVTVTLVCSLSLETTSTRSIPEPINITVENDPLPVLLGNASVPDVFDVRSPPNVQNQIREKISSKYHQVESSHVGVAIPVEADVDTLLEESTKKMNFYKLERSSTTPSEGISTWVLLSGHDITTTKKPMVKPVTVKNETNNDTLVTSEKPVKVFKPVFKQRSTTNRPAVSTSKTTTVRVNTFTPSAKSTTRKPTKLTKVKASLLHGASTTTTTTTQGITTSVSSTTPSPQPPPPTTTTRKTEVSKKKRVTTSTTTEAAAAALPIEAKDGDQPLPSEEPQKAKKKRKKNKNRRRKPSKASKEGNDNKLKESVDSAGTQLYSYFRSEIIPVTVGVSLVGLLVTAGLASYYLQPFAALRRSDPVDRKDTEGGYYYHDSSYSNSMPEEEAIGKVIAGMPKDVLQEGGSNTYKNPTSKKAQNLRYRHVDRRSQIYMNPYGSVEDVKLHDVDPDRQNNNNEQRSEEKKFVVGSIPQEVVTPAVVPEHGPRSFRQANRRFVVGSMPREFFSTGGASPRGMKNVERRKRREAIPDESENEIFHDESSEVVIKDTTTEGSREVTTTSEEDVTVTTEEVAKETTPHNIYSPSERPNTLFELLADLLKLKVKMGLELIQNITSSVTTYVSKVQARLDEHYHRSHLKHA